MKKSELKELIKEVISEVGGSSLSREDVITYLAYMYNKNTRLDKETKDAFGVTLSAILKDMSDEVFKAKSIDHLEVFKYLDKLVDRHEGNVKERIMRTSRVAKDMADPESRNRPFEPGDQIIR
jgi:hypothetical protein